MATLLENNTLNLQNVNQTVHDLFNLTATDTPYGSKWKQSLLCGSIIKKIDNYYITVSLSGILISTNGRDWQITNNTSSMVFSNSSSFDIYKYNDIYFLGVGSKGVLYSYDLFTWYPSILDTGLSYLYCFNNNLLYNNYTGVYKYSNSTLEWEKVLTVSSTSTKMVMCQNELFIIANSSNIYASTDFGNTWSLRYTFAGSQWYFTTLNDILYTGGNNGPLKSSDKGVTWVEAYDSEGSALPQTFDKILYEYNAVANKYIVSWSHPYMGYKYYYYSEDLINFTPIKIDNEGNYSIFSFLNLNNKIVAFASNYINNGTNTEYFFTIWETTDLNNWVNTVNISLDIYSCNAAAYYNNTLFITTTAGMMQYSTNFTDFHPAYVRGAALPTYSGMGESFNQIDSLFYYYSGSSYIYFIDN